MKLTFKPIVLATALLCAGNLAAQETDGKNLFEKYNWFVSGTLNGEWLFKTQGNTYVGGKISGGIYLDRFSAIRANLFAGKTRIDSKEAEQYGIGLDYVVTLIGNNGYRPFNLSASLGASYNYFSTDRLGITSKDVSTIGGTFAIQASYNVNRKVSLFIEPSLSILPKYYKEENNEEMYLQTNLAVGITYSFKDKYRSGKKQLQPTEAFPVSREDVQEIKDKMNRMQEDINVLKEDVQERRRMEEGKKLVIEPGQKESVAIDIRFEEFSSFISREQAAKVESIGEWMKENPASIKIVAFSDNLKDKETEEELRKKRTEAIRSLLTEKYHIAPERIESATPESMGYENKTGSNAMIIYIPDNH